MKKGISASVLVDKGGQCQLSEGSKTGSENIQGHAGSVNRAVICISTREINYKKLAGMSYPASSLVN